MTVESNCVCFGFALLCCLIDWFKITRMSWSHAFSHVLGSRHDDDAV